MILYECYKCHVVYSTSGINDFATKCTLLYPSLSPPYFKPCGGEKVSFYVQGHHWDDDEE